MADLKPCPFCGATDLIFEPQMMGTAACVRCVECLSAGPLFRSDDWMVPLRDKDDKRPRARRQGEKLTQHAAELWSRRVVPAAIQSAIEELKAESNELPATSYTGVGIDRAVKKLEAVVAAISARG